MNAVDARQSCVDESHRTVPVVTFGKVNSMLKKKIAGFHGPNILTCPTDNSVYTENFFGIGELARGMAQGARKH